MITSTTCAEVVTESKRNGDGSDDQRKHGGNVGKRVMVMVMLVMMVMVMVVSDDINNLCRGGLRAREMLVDPMTRENMEAMLGRG